MIRKARRPRTLAWNASTDELAVKIAFVSKTNVSALFEACILKLAEEPLIKAKLAKLAEIEAMK